MRMTGSSLLVEEEGEGGGGLLHGGAGVVVGCRRCVGLVERLRYGVIKTGGAFGGGGVW